MNFESLCRLIFTEALIVSYIEIYSGAYNYTKN